MHDLDALKVGVYKHIWKKSSNPLQLVSISNTYIKIKPQNLLIMKAFIGLVLAVIIGVILASYVKTALKIS